MPTRITSNTNLDLGDIDSGPRRPNLKVSNVITNYIQFLICLYA